MTSWDAIVSDYAPVLLRLTCRILGPGPDAEDAVQEAFLEGFRVSRNETVDNWGGLLRRVAVNRSLDRLRRRRNIEPLDVRETAGRGQSPEQAAIAKELMGRLREAITRLPPQQTAVFCLRYFEEMTYNQIAETLGIEEGAVGTALNKARHRLQGYLAEKTFSKPE
jgi:RNA polymerase sigma-70 factor, ECF subfamily